MPDFRTQLLPSPSSIPISYQDFILSMGSCFAEHIGGLLARHKFGCLLNPFGILYNPVSLGQGLHTLLSGNRYREADLFQHQGVWHSFDHHGRFSHPDRGKALEAINYALEQARDFLAGTNRLLLTLGTANVFILRSTGAVVANCHKVPGQQFDRRRLSVAEVVSALEEPLQLMRARHPGMEVILTLSPVRHTRDGLQENSRSKATLLLAIDELERRLPFIHYYPAWELLLDDLRDYRFYERDLVHPNAMAVDYVWEHFQATFFDEPTRRLANEVNRLVTAGKHRPIHPQTLQHQAFLQQQLARIGGLEKEYPFLNFASEKAAIEKQLATFRKV